MLGETALANEPQFRGWLAIEDATATWPDDRVAAVDALLAFARNDRDALQTEAGMWIVRMAVRTGDRAAIEEGIAVFHDAAAMSTGAIRPIQREWIAAALDEPRRAAQRCEAVSAEFDALGRLLGAADALADAAVHWDRAAAADGGVDPVAADRARAAAELATTRYVDIGVVPPLGWPLGASSGAMATAPLDDAPASDAGAATDPARHSR